MSDAAIRMLGGLLKYSKNTLFVMPAQAGIQLQH
jgi:hypothetical protein